MIPGRNRREKTQKRRIVLAGIFFVILASLIVFRAYVLHLTPNPRLDKWTKRGYEKIVPLSPQRGDIYDSNGRNLASSIKTKSLYVNPRLVQPKAAAAGKLSKVLKKRKSQILKKLKSRKYFVWLKRKTDPANYEKVKSLDIEGIGAVEENKRFYPNKELASSVIGFTGIDSNGLAGIELEYEKYLRSKEAKYVGLKDALGRTIFTKEVFLKKYARGNDLYLTLDRNIQYIAETELDEELAKSGASKGYAIVMEPHSGKILAMVSRPGFNPNDFSKSGPESWINGNVSLVYEPGSTLKVFSIAAALEEGLINPGDIFYCKKGTFSVAGKVIRDGSDRGWLTPASIIKYSSNIGAAKIAMLLGREKLYNWLKAFGFGEYTGVDMPGEVKGILRHYSTWYEMGIANIGFGQGIAITPLQLISALSTVANGGYRIKPFIVESIKYPQGRTVVSNSAEKGPRVISASTVKVITNFMIGVTETDGTGTRAAIPGFSVAGKTGTAQKVDAETGTYSSDKTIVSFMGFVPANDPKIAVLVVIDEPREASFGGTIAAPVFKKIAQKTLKYMKVVPSLEPEILISGAEQKENTGNVQIKLVSHNTHNSGSFEGSINQNMRQFINSELAKDTVPDFQGLSVREVLRLATDKGIDVSLEGTGISFKQSLRPGTLIKNKTRCVVYFRPI